MGVPAGMVKWSIAGTAPSSEIFNTSFWTLGGGSDLGELQDAVNAVASAIKTNLTNTLLLIGSDTTYDSVTGYSYTTGGTKADFAAEASLGPAAGTNTGHAVPLQVCAVLSLRTDVLGRSARGRMYLPANGASIDATHQLSSSLVDAVNGEWATIFTAVQEIILDNGGNPTVVVVSHTHTSFEPVTHLTMDTRCDIQRRRANKQTANHVADVTVGP